MVQRQQEAPPLKTISIVTHAYNEEDNIEAMYLRVREIMQSYR